MPSENTTKNGFTKALAVFHSGKSPFAKFLKPGFGHTFVCLLTDGEWICADAYKGRVELRYVCKEEEELAGIFRGMGYTVVETEQSEKTVKFPFVARNCVGMVKSILCLSNFALTPYGLYRRLVNEPRRR